MKRILLVISMLCMLVFSSCISGDWKTLSPELSSGKALFSAEYTEFNIEDMPCVAVLWSGELGVTCDWSAR